MSFSFSTTANASQSSTRALLKGNEIHTVKFDGCEIKDIQGVKDPSQTYKTLLLKFSNDDGIYEHTVFEPRQSDFERNTSGTYPQPSNVESMMLLFKHAIDTINPEIAKAINEGTKNLGAADWNGLRKIVADILEKGKGTQTKIKLITNTKGVGVFPGFFAGLTKENKPYMRNNFIGGKVGFTAYEIEKINNASKAKVTNNISNIDPILGTTQGTEQFNLDAPGAELNLNFGPVDFDNL